MNIDIRQHGIQYCLSPPDSSSCVTPHLTRAQEILHLHSAIRSALEAFADGARGLAADGRGGRDLEALVERHRFLRAVKPFKFTRNPANVCRVTLDALALPLALGMHQKQLVFL